MASDRLEGEWVECIPNFSFGHDPVLLAEFRRCLADLDHVHLLDAGQDPDHNRAVLTIAAAPGQVESAALALLHLACARIDISRHRGVHPRIGATDVFPLVPLGSVTLQRCGELARAIATRAARELDLPIFLYGAAAPGPTPPELPSVRRRGRAFLAGEPAGPGEDARPDLGPTRPHPTAGACAVGARDVLIAYNIQLDRPDPDVAGRIARAVRASSGGLPGVRALGLPLASEGLSQVSMNLCDPGRTGLVQVFRAVERLARGAGVAVVDSELIGLAPACHLDGAVARAIRLRDFDPERQVLERRLAAVVGA